MSTSIISPDVNEISEASFSDGWARVTGYRPAAVLTDRRAMIAMLMEEIAVLPVFPQQRASSPRRSVSDDRGRRLRTGER